MTIPRVPLFYCFAEWYKLFGQCINTSKKKDLKKHDYVVIIALGYLIFFLFYPDMYT